MHLEEELEIRFCSVRRSGRELLEYAQAVGKRVILISDMYLEEETIRKILAKCGISGFEKIFISCEYRKLKRGGGLFLKAASEIGVRPHDLFHIGDTDEFGEVLGVDFRYGQISRFISTDCDHGHVLFLFIVTHAVRNP